MDEKLKWIKKTHGEAKDCHLVVLCYYRHIFSGFLSTVHLKRLVFCCHLLLEETSVENKVLTDGTVLSNLNYLLFYNINVAEVGSSVEVRAQIFIGYLCQRTFQFFTKRFLKLASWMKNQDLIWFSKAAFLEGY